MREAQGFRVIPVLIVVAGLGGCATPQYQTAYRYEPPADAEGRACVQACEHSKQGCQSGCQARYEACQKNIEPLVEEHYIDSLRQYEQELRDYALELQYYRMQIWMSWPYDAWPHYLPPYPVPDMPTRDDAKAALEMENCQADCGCLPDYDACFVGCGGRRVPETLCIRNCPQQK